MMNDCKKKKHHPRMVKTKHFRGKGDGVDEKWLVEPCVMKIRRAKSKLLNRLPHAASVLTKSKCITTAQKII